MSDHTHVLIKRKNDHDHLYRQLDGIRIAHRDSSIIQLSSESAPNSFSFVNRQCALDFMQSIADAEMTRRQCAGDQDLFELLYPTPIFTPGLASILEVDKSDDPNPPIKEKFDDSDRR